MKRHWTHFTMATSHYTLHSTHSRLAAAWWPIPSCRASILSLLSLELSTPGEYRPRKQFQIQMSLQVQFAQALMALYTFLAQLAGWIAVLKQFITWHGTSPDHCPLSSVQVSGLVRSLSRYQFTSTYVTHCPLNYLIVTQCTIVANCWAGMF